MIRQCMMLIALILLLLPVAGARADSTDGVFCGDLSEADCRILLDNDKVMRNVNSLGFSLSMSMETGAEEALQFSAQAYGGFEVDDEALAVINEMSANAAEADLGKLIEMILTSAKAALTLDLRDYSGEEEVQTQLNLKLKDGIVLIGADTLEALTGESMGGMDAFGVDLTGAIGDLLAESGAMPTADLSEFEAAEDVAMSVTRLPDTEVDGVAVAVFRTDIDLNTFFSMVSAEQLVAATSEVDDPQAISDFIDSIDVSDFHVTQYIGLDDHYTYRMDMLMDLALPADMEDLGQVSSFVMDMVIELSSFGEPVDVSIPEDAFVLPLAMMMQMGSQ